MAPTAVDDSLPDVTYANFDEQDQRQIVLRQILADGKKIDHIGIPGGYQCLTLEDTFAYKACNVPVHMERLLRKPVPLCSPTDPSWTPTVASVETPPLVASVETTPPMMLSLTPPVASVETPPMMMLSLTPPVASVETTPPMMLLLTPPVASVETPPPMIHLVHDTSNYPPQMFPPHPYNHQGPQHQASVMHTYTYPPYPFNHPGNTQNTGNGKKQGNGKKRGIAKKIMKTLSSALAISSMLATLIGNGFLLSSD